MTLMPPAICKQRVVYRGNTRKHKGTPARSSSVRRASDRDSTRNPRRQKTRITLQAAGKISSGRQLPRIPRSRRTLAILLNHFQPAEKLLEGVRATAAGKCWSLSDSMASEDRFSGPEPRFISEYLADVPKTGSIRACTLRAPLTLQLPTQSARDQVTAASRSRERTLRKTLGSAMAACLARLKDDEWRRGARRRLVVRLKFSSLTLPMSQQRPMFGETGSAPPPCPAVIARPRNRMNQANICSGLWRECPRVGADDPETLERADDRRRATIPSHARTQFHTRGSWTRRRAEESAHIGHGNLKALGAGGRASERMQIVGSLRHAGAGNLRRETTDDRRQTIDDRRHPVPPPPRACMISSRPRVSDHRPQQRQFAVRHKTEETGPAEACISPSPSFCRRVPAAPSGHLFRGTREPPDTGKHPQRTDSPTRRWHRAAATGCSPSVARSPPILLLKPTG
ncbi:unnamed protein product [Diplocarpon coronariae]